MVVATLAVWVWMTSVAPATTTVSWSSPGSRTALTVAGTPTFSVTSLSTTVLKPISDTVAV